jgi:MFS family permease
VAARVVIGVAVGSASMVVPLYIGGTAPPRVRGGLVSFNQLAARLGDRGGRCDPRRDRRKLLTLVKRAQAEPSMLGWR